MQQSQIRKAAGRRLLFFLKKIANIGRAPSGGSGNRTLAAETFANRAGAIEFKGFRRSDDIFGSHWF